ncbi:MAG: response regulator transcription factor [Actinobacteria bacterium]|nr:MAG: response regulator transcription factor [Actinomycetota bacterium]
MLDAATEGRGDREIRSALRPMTTVPEAAAAGDAQRADEGPIRVFLVADVCVYRELLVDALANHESLEVVGHTPADIAGMAVGMTEPTVVLVDTSAGDGFSRVQALAAALLLDLVEAGVAGCITAEQPLEELVEAVEAATNGELKCSPRVAGALAERVAALKAARPTANEEPRLTRRQREIAALISEGLSNKQIARRLSIQQATVKNHVHNILGKLGVSHRDEVATLVRTSGLT